MKTYIIFDTNILYMRDYKDFSIFEINSIYAEVQGKIERNNVIDRFELMVPEITIKELFKQQLQSYSTHIETMKSSYLKFEQIYDIDLRIDEKFDYENFLDKKKEQYISSKAISILPICKEEKFVRIVERALNKEAPFEGKDKKSDKGFKDALIWESLLEFAEMNDGEYIFFTADKGFKKELEHEFIEVTRRNIKIYGRDDKQKLDIDIEKYSVEKSTRMRLELVQENLESLLNTLLNELEYKAFQEVELNGILCAVSDFEIIPKLIDLNEVGDKRFKFKMQGKMKAGKTGISYELKTSLYFLVEVDNLVSSQIQVIKLENIDATSMEDDIINIADIPFELYPEEEELNSEEELHSEEEELNSEEKLHPEEEELNSEEELHPEEESTVSISRESFINVFANTELEKDEKFFEGLTRTIKNSYTVDWADFDSKKAQMKLAIKTYLRREKFDSENVETITDSIIEKLIEDYNKIGIRV
ncbi:PIN domain-containing protein [Bacillus thuringiensis]|uniref:PIN domain-containing protein n=1 Tax=Bacillus thuringiensis TaxID=1428 RepID=UPI000A36DC9F|nr:PIN domain-containing protein [Bacillus thuringiensis]MCU4722016.1 PIN domain-containing protein [Bacillus cereus]MBG9749810.1 hypothetical protein [Bacillus thuringiensis]MBG9776506.1 hypothetical protein [Bacillus thuringiensis]MBG9924248.1 hypothetical protein [Bacillus thuringiensis]OTZ89110.1 hypothetical protein BK771_08025 [Bacillus thuringiensis serovar ostriniae]